MDDNVEEARTLREIIQKDREEIDRLKLELNAALERIKELENAGPTQPGKENGGADSQVTINNT